MKRGPISERAEIRYAKRDLVRKGLTLTGMAATMEDHRAGLHKDLYEHQLTCYACLVIVRRAAKAAQTRRRRR